MGDRRFGHDAVPQIEDMRPVGEAGNDLLDPLLHLRPAGHQPQRIEIALHRQAGRQASSANSTGMA